MDSIELLEIYCKMEQEDKEYSALPWSDLSDVQLRAGEVSVWGGDSNHGKTTLIYMALLSWISQGKKVAIDSHEMPPERMMNALSKMFARRGAIDGEGRRDFAAPFANWSTGSVRLLPKGEGKNINQIIDDMREFKHLDHYIIDNLMTTVSNTSASSQVNNNIYIQQVVMNKLTDAASELNMHVHVIAHTGKPNKDSDQMNSISGAKEIVNLATNMFIVERLYEADVRKLKCNSIITQIKRRYEPEGGVLIERQNGARPEARLKLDMASGQLTKDGTPINFTKHYNDAQALTTKENK